jgi:hypothetical protein
MYFHEKIFEAADAIVTPMTGYARVMIIRACNCHQIILNSLLAH